jgi:hypothetical protein
MSSVMASGVRGAMTRTVVAVALIGTVVMGATVPGDAASGVAGMPGARAPLEEPTGRRILRVWRSLTYRNVSAAHGTFPPLRRIPHALCSLAARCAWDRPLLHRRRLPSGPEAFSSSAQIGSASPKWFCVRELA